MEDEVLNLDATGHAYLIGFLAHRIQNDGVIYRADFAEAIRGAKKNQKKEDMKNERS